MLNKLKFGLCAAVGAVVALSLTPASAEDQLIKGNLRLVIGSTSTGGDTYQSASILAEELADRLGVNIRVDAVGPAAAFRAIDRKGKSGNTIMLFHDQSYLGEIYGVRGYDNIFEKYIIGPTVAINPGNGYAVAKDSPIKDVPDLIKRAGEGEKIRFGIQPGGASEIGLSALKNAVRMKYPGAEKNLVPVNVGSQADKNQLIFDDRGDVIHASVQGNEQYTRLPAEDQKAMRFLWLTAREETMSQANPEGMGETTREQLLKFVEPNVYVPMNDSENMTYDKEFFLIYNKGMSEELVKYLDNAVGDVFANTDINVTYKNSFFIPNYLPSDEARSHLLKKRNDYKTILDNIH